MVSNDLPPKPDSDIADTAPVPPPAEKLAVHAAGTQPLDAAHPPLPDALSWQRTGFRIVVVFGIGLVVCALAYLVVAIPGTWFPSANTAAWTADGLQLARGTGRVIGDELVVTAPDATGMTIVSATTDVRSTDYPEIAWIAIDVPAGAEVSLLWQTDYAPAAVNSVPLRVDSGRVMPVRMRGHAKWIGRIKGLALAVRHPLPQPMRVRGVVAKSMGAAEVLGDRGREWLAFEGWTGTSINTVTGGADIQDLPLPALLAAATVLACALAMALQHWRPGYFGVRFGFVLIGAFLAGWLILDVRWTWNLVRQAAATVEQYGGRTMRERILSDADGQLYEFIEKARTILPATPVRIFVVSDAHYLRGRAAYHLYPNNVYFQAVSNTMPPASQLKPGDWLLAYQRRGVQYDAALQRLRWDDNQTVAAELKLVDRGGALFVIR